MTEFIRHPRWGELIGVVGYVDYLGAVHAIIRFQGDPCENHATCFPANTRYKTWRWNKSDGLVLSMLCNVDPDDADFWAINNWLFKNGCLNKWELPE